MRELIASCGYGPHEPLVVAIDDRIHTQGCTRTGAPVTADTATYLASLSKQFTAACVAILVADGRLDVETPAAEFVPRLPPAIRVRNLLHHTAGLPDDVVVTGDRTSDGILAALPTFDATPGIRYAYSNVGYVCLARIVETVCGAPIGDFARTAVFDPLEASLEAYDTPRLFLEAPGRQRNRAFRYSSSVTLILRKRREAEQLHRYVVWPLVRKKDAVVRAAILCSQRHDHPAIVFKVVEFVGVNDVAQIAGDHGGLPRRCPAVNTGREA